MKEKEFSIEDKQKKNKSKSQLYSIIDSFFLYIVNSFFEYALKMEIPKMLLFSLFTILLLTALLNIYDGVRYFIKHKKAYKEKQQELLEKSRISEKEKYYLYYKNILVKQKYKKMLFTT